MAIDRKNYSNVPDEVLSGALLMDAGLARLIQKEVEAKGLFKDISFLEARERLIEYSFQLDDEEETDDMLEDDYSGRMTHFADRLKMEIGAYIARFSEKERRILVNAGRLGNPMGSGTLLSLMIACERYIPRVEGENRDYASGVEEKMGINIEGSSSKSRLASFFRRFYRPR